jgi:hypothetical protein
MWEPRRLTILWAFTASLSFLPAYIRSNAFIYARKTLPYYECCLVDKLYSYKVVYAVTPYSQIEVHRCFGARYCFRLQEIEAENCFNMLVVFYQTTQRHIYCKQCCWPNYRIQLLARLILICNEDFASVLHIKIGR